MRHSWNDVKWIFETDESLIDLYVQEVSISDWEKVIGILNCEYSAGIDRDHAIQYLAAESGEVEGVSASIELNGVRLNCHFFLPDQIEFDLDPKEVDSIESFQDLVDFMEVISKALSNQVTLTGENSPRFPLIKIDYHQGVNRVLSEQEAEALWRKGKSIGHHFMALKSRVGMKLFPKRFEEKLLRSGLEPYTSTKKDENVW